MIEEFTHLDLIKYIKGDLDQELRKKIEYAITVDQELKEAIDNLKESLPVVNQIVKHTRRNQFAQWMTEDSPPVKTNYFRIFTFLVVILLLLSVTMYFLFRSYGTSDTQSTQAETKTDSLSGQKGDIPIYVDTLSKKENDTLEKTLVSPNLKKIEKNKTKQIFKKTNHPPLNSQKPKEEGPFAYEEMPRDRYLDEYEFDYISVLTRGPKVDNWKMEAITADSLYKIGQYKNALAIYKNLEIHPEIWERLSFTYSRLQENALAFEYYTKYKELQINLDESDWGEWLILLNALPDNKRNFDEKTRQILDDKQHKYYNRVKQFCVKYPKICRLSGK